MNKYYSKPHASYWDDGEWEDVIDNGHKSCDVICVERDTFTGLYDDEGRELHKLKQPIGFLRNV